MEMTIELNGDVTIMSITERLEAANSNSLKLFFEENSSESKKIIIDLKELEFIDSTGLGILVSFYKICETENKQLKICNLQEKAKMVFEITRAYKIFDIYDSSKSAIEAFES